MAKQGGKEGGQPAGAFVKPGCTAADLWKAYWDQIKPAGPVPEVQYVETRRAFYAGLWAMLEVMGRTGEVDVPELVAVRWLSSLRKEIRSAVK